MLLFSSFYLEKIGTIVKWSSLLQDKQLDVVSPQIVYIEKFINKI